MKAHDRGTISIQEQTVDDPVSGFTFKFIIANGSDHPSRLLFKSRSETIWREYMFDVNGEFCGATVRAGHIDQQPVLRLVK
jgi:hypothetical protein